MQSHQEKLDYNENQLIPCPVCKNDIHFEWHTLLKGAPFNCSNCDTKVGLQAHAIPQARDIFNKCNVVKELIKQRPTNNNF